MIRFQVCIFDILNTAQNVVKVSCVSCDSLSSLYLWHIKYSSFQKHKKAVLVVIRFQVCIFDILNTAEKSIGKQPACCDSLSSLYLWHIKYSYGKFRKKEWIVVIRFQVCIFDILNTAYGDDSPARRLLWFAFKFVSLTY